MDMTNKQELLKQVLEVCSFDDLKDLLRDCVNRTMNQIDKNKISDLCNQIKEIMKQQNREQLILRIAYINNDDDWDDDEEDEYESNIDEDTYSEYSLDSDTRLVSYDCGNYSRTLQMSGVLLEDDELKFYLIEVDMSENGDEDKNLYIEDIDGLMDDRCWWWSYNMPENIFDPEKVLKTYIELLSNEDFIQTVDN